MTSVGSTDFPDPIEYVEKFEAIAESWRSSIGLPLASILQSLDAPQNDQFFVLSVSDLITLTEGVIKAQVQVNAMMLAAIDELRKQQSSSDRV